MQHNDNKQSNEVNSISIIGNNNINNQSGSKTLPVGGSLLQYKCDACGRLPIQNCRYTCNACNGEYDLCDACFQNVARFHNEDHVPTFVKVMITESYGKLASHVIDAASSLKRKSPTSSNIKRVAEPNPNLKKRSVSTSRDVMEMAFRLINDAGFGKFSDCYMSTNVAQRFVSMVQAGIAAFSEFCHQTLQGPFETQMIVSTALTLTPIKAKPHAREIQFARSQKRIVLAGILASLVAQIVIADTLTWFKEPVEIEDYREKIKEPMDLTSLHNWIVEAVRDSKMTEEAMVDEFARKLNKIWENAIVYNGEMHPVSKDAKSLAKSTRESIIRIAESFELLKVDANEFPTLASIQKYKRILETKSSEGSNRQVVNTNQIVKPNTSKSPSPQFTTGNSEEALLKRIKIIEQELDKSNRNLDIVLRMVSERIPHLGDELKKISGM